MLRKEVENRRRLRPRPDQGLPSAVEMEELEKMRPFGVDDVEYLRVARARAEELREDWRIANSGRPRADRGAVTAPTGVRHVARAAAGRGLIGLGRRLLPQGIEPCS
jgi:hypothetical protein